MPFPTHRPIAAPLLLIGLTSAGIAWAGARAHIRRLPSHWFRTPIERTRDTSTFRVCADPNNLPFTNDRGEGFENGIADLIARDLGKRLEYTWWAQRRGFVRNTLNSYACDVVIGVPVGYDPVRTTHPYYRSSYVFVSRRDRRLHLVSLDDPQLRRLRIGLHLIGDDYANSPAAQSLAQRGLAANVVGYTLYGDYSRPDPPARLIDAVVDREVDVAVVWGPLAGYFARRSPVPLDIRVVTPAQDGAMLYEYSIAMGVRRRDTAQAAVLNRELVRRKREIERILFSYGVPLLPPASR